MRCEHHEPGSCDEKGERKPGQCLKGPVFTDKTFKFIVSGELREK